MEQGARLLILDNDAGIVELAAWFLERKGYRVRTARSFREARAQIDHEWPDLFLSDIDLGEESGAEELPRLAGEGRLPPTLIVSGYLDADLANRLSALPAVRGTLVKPFDLAVLEQRVEECLERSSTPATRENERTSETARARPATDSAADLEEDDAGWIEIRPYDPRGVPMPERD
jgi:DNA-binding NtrC family response regulator